MSEEAAMFKNTASWWEELWLVTLIASAGDQLITAEASDFSVLRELTLNFTS